MPTLEGIFGKLPYFLLINVCTVNYFLLNSISHFYAINQCFKSNE